MAEIGMVAVHLWTKPFRRSSTVTKISGYKMLLDIYFGKIDVCSCISLKEEI